MYADGGGSSLELRDPDADNNRAEAWAPSDESTESSWQTYTYRAVSSEPMSVGANLQQFILGLLDEGELLLDDVSVIRDPGGANQQVIVNGSFENDAVGSTPAGWRLVGNHGSGSVQLDGSNKVLHLIAEGPQEHIHDHVTVDFGNGESIQDGEEYEISLRAKWLAGSAQLNNRFYFTRMANTFILDVPENNGTPGAQNSTFESNVGPTYADLVQNPVLPAAGEPVTITVRADDPDGISAINLKYAVNEGGFSTLPMTLDDDGLFKATIPGQSTSSTVQFYVEGSDALGAVSTFPAAGAASRALYFVGAGSATASPIDTVRIIMLSSDRNNLTVRYNEMSNQYIGASIVHTINSANGPIDVAYHDVEVRQVGSRFVRPNSGYKIRLRPDQKFYGVHESIRLDMSNIGEIYMKHMVARAGGSSVSMYDDVAVMVDPRHGTRTVLLQLARYEDDYLREQFADGNEGTKWELDDIVIPTEPVQLGYLNDEAITNQDIRYRGPDPESYRGQLLIKNQRYKDDYQAIVDFAWAIHRTNQQELYDATKAVMDVDLWMRHYATQAFLGNWDTYGFGRPKNLRIYVRPEDGKIIPLYWDADLGNLTEPFIWNGNVSRLDDIRDIPQNLRLFWGHMWDLTNRSFNGDYMAPWLAYYSQLGVGMPSAAQLNSRANSARSQAQSAIPLVSFQITTNAGNNFSVDELSATLEGTGWIDVRNIYLAGSDVPLEVTWTGINTWQLEVPLAPGANQVTLQAYDFEAGLIASDTITITSTVPDRPLYDYLRITELHYHPQQAEEHEFIEVTNTGDDAINLAGVQIASFASEPYVFSSGITLEAGQRIVVARNPDVFESYYGTGFNLAPTGYANANLSNGGESISLVAPGGEVLQHFQFYDSNDWPPEADGQGPSLEYFGPFDQDAVDPMTIGGDPYDTPAYWKASRQVGGTPGFAPTQLVGDYDYSGVVDSGDHAFWRSGYGISALIVGAGADGNFDGLINAADYVVWRKNLGTLLPAPALAAFVASGEPAAPRASAPLPEPHVTLAVAAAIHSPRNESPFGGDGAQVKSTSVTAVGEDRQAAFGLLSRLRQFTRLGNEAYEVAAEPIRYEAPEELVEELLLLAEEEDPFAVWDEV